MRPLSALMFFLLLASTVFAETHEIQVGTVGKTVIGETASGGGEYFIGLGRAVNVGHVGTVALVIGEAVNVSGDVNGDLYAIGKAVNIGGNVRGVAYVIAEQLTLNGTAGKVVAAAKTVIVEGNVEELNCSCGSVIVEKGAHVGRLSGEAENVKIDGQVLANSVKIKEPKRAEQTPLSKAKEWITGLISMIILAFALKRWRRWGVADLKDIRTYIYGLVALAAPLVLIIVFIISLAVAELGVLFGAILGLEIAVFGVWLAALMAAGVPVYDLLGKAVLEKVGRENYYASVALGYTLCFLVSLAFPVWIFVAFVGLGLLVRAVHT